MDSLLSFYRQPLVRKLMTYYNRVEEIRRVQQFGKQLLRLVLCHPFLSEQAGKLLSGVEQHFQWIDLRGNVGGFEIFYALEA